MPIIKYDHVNTFKTQLSFRRRKTECTVNKPLPRKMFLRILQMFRCYVCFRSVDDKLPLYLIYLQNS